MCRLLPPAAVLVSCKRKNFPEDFAEKWLPIQTTRNMCIVCALGMALTLQQPEDTELPLLGRCFAEKVCEHFFSRAKAGFRGQPCIGNGITGIQRDHMRQASQVLQVDPGLDDSAGRLPPSRAASMAKTTWEHCLQFVTWVEPGLKCDELEEEFKMWWASEGVAAVSMNAATMENDDLEEDEDLDKEEQPDEAAAMSDDKNLAVLQNVEDQMKAKAEIEKLAQSIVNGEESQKSEEPVQVSLEKASDRTFLSILKMCADTDAFAAPDSSKEACLKKQQQLKPTLLEYVRRTRLRENILSAAMLTGETKYQSSGWHKMEHELALARQASLSNGTRQTRAAAWRVVQSKIEEAVKCPKTDGKLISAITHYVPEKEDVRQVVVFKLAGDASLNFGIIKSVFRGSVTKKNGEASRKMRVSKLAVNPLPAGSVSRVIVQCLTKYSGHSFFACGLSPDYLLDPAQHILGEIKVGSFKCTAEHTLLSVSDATLEAVERLKEQPSLLKPVTISLPIPDVGESVPGKGKIWTWMDFTRQLQGTYAIQRWMRDLPSLYEAAEIPLLNQEKQIVVKAASGAEWEEVALRTPDAFDLLLDKVTGAKFGKSVLHNFLQLVPDKKDPKGCVHKIVKFVEKVDYLATPVHGSWMPVPPVLQWVSLLRGALR